MSPSHEWYGIIPGWLPFYALILVALVLFGLRVTYLVRVMLTGTPAARWDDVPARLRAVLVFVLGQLRLIRGDFWPGLMHATIFWGFLAFRRLVTRPKRLTLSPEGLLILGLIFGLMVTDLLADGAQLALTPAAPPPR